MPFGQAWNEAQPDGDTTLRSDVDTVIQNLKVAIRERLDQVITSFGNDLVDPKKLISSSVSLNRAEVGQSVPTSPAETAINWTAEEWDEGGFHNNAVNNTRITVPAGLGGKYTLSVQFSYAPSGVGTARAVRIRKNGITLLKSTNRLPAGTSASTDVLFVGTFDLVAGDYLEVLALQDSGANLDVQGSQVLTFAQIVRVG